VHLTEVFARGQPGKDQLTLEGQLKGVDLLDTLDMTAGLYGMQYELKTIADISLDASKHRNVDILGSFEELPFRNGVFKKVLFDPPHVLDSRNTLLGTFPYYPGGEPHLSTFKYGCYRTIDQLRKAIYRGASEAERVLEVGGHCIFKWSDSEKPFSWAHDTVRKAARSFEQVHIGVTKSRAHSGNLTIVIDYKKLEHRTRLYES
jgi:hypothetical protein